jgi:hypothetical protein
MAKEAVLVVAPGCIKEDVLPTRGDFWTMLPSLIAVQTVLLARRAVIVSSVPIR